jgi:hypothetical protein
MFGLNDATSFGVKNSATFKHTAFNTDFKITKLPHNPTCHVRVEVEVKNNQMSIRSLKDRYSIVYSHLKL